MDDDGGPSSSRKLTVKFATRIGSAAVLIALLIIWRTDESAGPGAHVFAQTVTTPGSEAVTLNDQTRAAALFEILTPSILTALLALILLSAFFSASEVAFFSIHRVRMRSMRESGTLTGVLIARLMEHRNRLLITILVGNSIVNVLISVLLPARMQQALTTVFEVPAWIAVVITVMASTYFLILLGEISPKVVVYRFSESFAKAAVLPLKAIDWMLTPIRVAIMWFTEFVFRLTRFHSIKAAPFITDEEFMSVLGDSAAQGVIENDEREMIENIVETGDAQIREILVPRPDVIAAPDSATVAECLGIFREKEFSRMPVYRDDIDHVTGILVAKDLLPSVLSGKVQTPVRTLARKPYFVPETMTIRGFVEDAQRKRMHMAIVVDEYGGTEGIVTLEDAIEEIVGEIHDTAAEAQPAIDQVNDMTYRVDGSVPLEDLSEAVGIALDDNEHKTLAGFFIEQTNKIPEEGDTVELHGAVFRVEAVEGKRAETFTVEVLEDSGTAAAIEKKEQTG